MRAADPPRTTLASHWPAFALGVALVAALGYIADLRADIRRLRGGTATAASAASTPPSMPSGPSAGGWNLSPDRRRAMLDQLRAANGGGTSPVWLVTDAGNSDAVAFGRELRAIFSEAGWQIRGASDATFALRPGVYVFMADETPPDYVLAVLSAFDATGITVTSGRGYRAFYEAKRRENPDWRGFALAPDQSYVLVVGRAN